MLLLNKSNRYLVVAYQFSRCAKDDVMNIIVIDI